MRLARLIPALLVSLVAGCTGPEPAEPPEAPPPRAALSPQEIGIEAHVWRVVAVGGPLPRALAPYLNEGAPDTDFERWRGAGFRLVEIPAELVDALEAGLPHTEAIRRHWLGQPTRWSRLASARADTPPPELHSHGPGRIELLTRCWAEPGLRTGRGFRVELAVAWSPDSPRPGATREQITNLYLSRQIPVGRALAIVPATPGEDWTPAEPSASPDDEPGPEAELAPPDEDTGVAALPAPGPTRDDDPAGPAPPSPPSVGERLMITPAALGDRPVAARRDVFILVPRWP